MTRDETVEVLLETARRSVADDIRITHPEDLVARMVVAMEDAANCLEVIREREWSRDV